jgi:RimJ/RimL family protein N-acetyltransferase
MHKDEVTHTERLHIRRFTANDIPGLATLFTDPEVMRFSTIRRTLSLKEIEDLIHTKILKEYTENGFGRYAVIKKDDGTLIGYAGISKQNILGLGTVVDLGYAFHKNYWGKGYATETAKALLAHAQNLNLSELVALVSQENTASQNVVLKSGLTPSGNIQLHGIAHIIYKISFVR